MKNLKVNFLYNAIYQILVIILPIITTPYISRVLGKDMIGLYSYSYSIVFYFGIFIILGLANYGNRIIATAREKSKEDISKAFLSIYTMQLIFGGIISVLYFVYLFSTSNDLIMGFTLYLYLLSVILDINWFYFGMEEFKLTVTRNMIIKIISTILIFIFINDANDIYIYAFILSFSTLISQMILFFFLPRFIILVKFNRSDVVKHIIPNLMLFIPVIAVSIYKVMDKVMLGFFVNYSEVGIYESSEKLIILPTAFISSLGTVMLPRISNLISNGQFVESLKYLKKTLYFSMFTCCALCFGTIAVLPEFVPVFYGDGFEKCIPVISIVILSSIFLSWGNVIRTQYLIPMKKDGIYIRSAIYGAIANFSINIILIFKFQSIGTAIGTLIAEAVVCVYQSYKIRNDIDFKENILYAVLFVTIGFTMVILIKDLMFFSSVVLNILCKIVLGAVYYLSLSFCVLIYIKRKREM